MDITLQIIFPVVVASIVGVGGWALKKIMKRQKEQAEEERALKNGILAILHDSIFRTYKLCSNANSITLEELEDLDYLYKPYHALGGNGTGTELYKRIKSMPIQKVEEIK